MEGKILGVPLVLILLVVGISALVVLPMFMLFNRIDQKLDTVQLMLTPAVAVIEPEVMEVATPAAVEVVEPTVEPTPTPKPKVVVTPEATPVE